MVGGSAETRPGRTEIIVGTLKYVPYRGCMYMVGGLKLFCFAACHDFHVCAAFDYLSADELANPTL